MKFEKGLYRARNGKTVTIVGLHHLGLLNGRQEGHLEPRTWRCHPYPFSGREGTMHTGDTAKMDCYPAPDEPQWDLMERAEWQRADGQEPEWKQQ